MLKDIVLSRTGEPETGLALPSLATVIRYRGRLDRGWHRAGEELAALRRERATTPVTAASDSASRSAAC